MSAEHDPANPVAKAVVAWAGVGFSYLGIHQWSDVAAVLASVYTAWLIFEKAYRWWKARKA